MVMNYDVHPYLGRDLMKKIALDSLDNVLRGPGLSYIKERKG